MWAVLAAAFAVHCYNSSLFKPRYLSGQVEVCCLMSSMCPQSGRCGVDMRLCPVSDWGLGLVTGPGLIGWLVPPQPAHAPSLRLPLGTRETSEAWMERTIGWLDGWLPLRGYRHTNTEVVTHTQSSFLSAIPWGVFCVPCQWPQPCPVCPLVPVDSHRDKAAVHKLHSASCDKVNRMHSGLDCCSQSMLIRSWC